MSPAVVAATGGYAEFDLADVAILLVVLPLCYALGSIPTAVVVARRRAVDIRSVGDRNPGYWNARETLGARAALPVLVVDAAKGAAAVGIGLWVQHAYRTGFDQDVWWIPYLCGLAAMVGHAWPVFARFRGGRCVATFVGAAIALAPLVALAALAACLLLLAVTRRFSVAARIGVFAYPAIQLAVDPATHVAMTGVLMSLVGLRFWQAHRRGDGSHPL